MKRILCHGDSLTEGTDIEAAYCWPSLLQNALGTEVINTGIGGGSQHSRRQWQGVTVIRVAAHTI